MARTSGAFWLIVCSVVSLALAACNTTAGVGRDVEATGDFIEDTAEDAKN